MLNDLINQTCQLCIHSYFSHVSSFLVIYFILHDLKLALDKRIVKYYIGVSASFVDLSLNITINLRDNFWLCCTSHRIMPSSCNEQPELIPGYKASCTDVMDSAFRSLYLPRIQINQQGVQ